MHYFFLCESKDVWARLLSSALYHLLLEGVTVPFLCFAYEGGYYEFLSEFPWFTIFLFPYLLFRKEHSPTIMVFDWSHECIGGFSWNFKVQYSLPCGILCWLHDITFVRSVLLIVTSFVNWFTAALRKFGKQNLKTSV